MSELADRTARRAWTAAMWATLLMLVANLVLVAVAGTDIPSFDQWDADGRWLLPGWRDGSLAWTDLLRPHNEHRILWSRFLTLGLFVANAQWDPLVELVAGAGLRAVAVGAIAWWLVRGGVGVIEATAGVVVVFFPAIAWHNVLWGFQSQVFFALGFTGMAIGLLATDKRSAVRLSAGLMSGAAALLAMGPSALFPVALLGLAALRSWEERRVLWQRVWPPVVLLVFAWVLRETVAEHESLRARSMWEFLIALGRSAGWPHTAQPVAAVVMNLPLGWWVCRRIRKRETGERSDEFVVAAGGWSLALAAGAAWMRGGSEEWAFGVPSRYAELLAVQVVANACCLSALVRHADTERRSTVQVMKYAWMTFVLAGLVGLTAEVLRRVILPRARDRAAPVRLAVEFQRTRDPGVFKGQWRTIVPHPDHRSISAVLDDDRMKGALPPSLQPERPMGPLSHAARKVLWRD